jgi:uncharacterized protein YxeA
MSQIEVRKLPKKTIVIIAIMIVTIIAGFLLITITKQLKMTEVLNSLGHTNIDKVRVYNVSPVEDEITKRRGELFKISFFDKETNQKCYGLVFKNDNKYTKDLECK